MSSGTYQFVPKTSRDTSIENIKSTKIFQIDSSNTEHQYKYECITSMVKKLLLVNPKSRPMCEDILDEPLFWNSCEVFNFLKALGPQFDSESSDYKNKIDTKWMEFLQSDQACIYPSNSENRNKSLVILLKEISSEVRIMTKLFTMSYAVNYK